MQDYYSFIDQMNQGLAAIQRIAAIEYEYNARKLVYEYNKVKLYHYSPHVNQVNAIPVLVVFATVNRPEILDLLPNQSFIKGLLKNGMDVYLLDWGYPDNEDVNISLSDYVSNYLYQCVNFIIRKSKQKKINLIGICQGGFLSLCYATLFSHIRNLVLISTPVDCHTRNNNVAKILKKIKFNDLIESNDNVPGNWLTQFFISMRPFELIGKKYLRFMDHIEDKEKTNKFLKIEKWLHDAPDQAGTAFKEFIEELYQENKLIQGKLVINGKKLNLAKLKIPVLNVMAREDEIVPMSASRALKRYIGSKDYSQRIFASGHIGIYVSEKVGEVLPKAISLWFKKRS